MRLRHVCLVGAILAPLSVAHAAVPQDERCLITMAAMAGNPQYADIGQPGIIFFASRLTAEQPNYDFAARMKVLMAQMGPKDLSAEAQRCAPLVIHALQGLQAAERAIHPPAGSAAPPPPPAHRKKSSSH